MDEILKKLQLKNFNNMLLLNLPDELKSKFYLDYDAQISEKYDLIIVFAYTMEEADKLIFQSISSLIPDTHYWFCYPKQSSKKYKSDINRDKSWSLFEKYNFRAVRNISINDDWSALRFRENK